MARRSRSRGIRPRRNAWITGVLGLAGIALLAIGGVDIRNHDGTGSPWILLGGGAALFGLVGFPIALHHAGRVRAMRRGAGLVARWVVPAEEFRSFVEAESRIPSRSVMVNYYRPPAAVPDAGIEVVFAGDGVLIGESYFPLPTAGLRQLESVRRSDAVPATLECSIGLASLARTSSVTVQSTRVLYLLRVPMARAAGDAARAVLEHYRR